MTWMRDKNLNLNKRDKMYTLEQCLEQQKKVDASITHEGTYMPWLAGIGEVIEMCEHLSLISTWKKQPGADMKQAFMELVDVFAFAMSAEKFIDDDTCNINIIHTGSDYNIEKGINYLIFHIVNGEFDQVLRSVYRMCVYLFDRPITDIYHYYMGKQTLTRFRQDNGYKNGTYIKMWGKLEDNEYLTVALENGVKIDDLYDCLREIYTRMLMAKAVTE